MDARGFGGHHRTVVDQDLFEVDGIVEFDNLGPMRRKYVSRRRRSPISPPIGPTLEEASRSGEPERRIRRVVGAMIQCSGNAYGPAIKRPQIADGAGDRAHVIETE